MSRPRPSQPAMPRREARRASLIDGRLRIHQQGDDVLDLLLGEDAVVPEARHVRARRERVRVVDLAVRVLLQVRREAADLAEVVEARTDGAVGELGPRELVARVAVAAGRNRRIVAVLLADAGLGDLLALLPVAEIIAVSRIL